MPKKEKTYRPFYWNWNNYPEDYEERLLKQMKGFKYMCFGEELAPTTGTPHIQGYTYFTSPRGLNATRKKNPGCHILPCDGSTESNIAYCSKTRPSDRMANEVFKEFGERPAQGNRTDIDSLRDRIVEGEEVDDMIMADPIICVRFERCLDRMANIVMRKKFRTEMTTCDWFWGPTGVKKSTLAFLGFSADTHYNFPNDGGWWDNYRQQDTVIINEFRGGIKFSELIDLIDMHPKEVRRRNKPPLPFISKHVIITSCFPPVEVYKNCGESMKQLTRRIKVTKMEEGDFETLKQKFASNDV